MEGNGEYLEKCKELVIQKELNNKIQFIINTTDIEPFLEKSSIGVISSDSEGLPLSILEYGLAELSVISTNVGQCAEVLGEGKFGLLVPKLDPFALANGIKFIIQNPTDSKNKALELNKHILQNYTSISFFNNYKKLIDIINSVIID